MRTLRLIIVPAISLSFASIAIADEHNIYPHLNKLPYFDSLNSNQESMSRAIENAKKNGLEVTIVKSKHPRLDFFAFDEYKSAYFQQKKGSVQLSAFPILVKSNILSFHDEQVTPKSNAYDFVPIVTNMNDIAYFQRRYDSPLTHPNHPNNRTPNMDTHVEAVTLGAMTFNKDSGELHLLNSSGQTLVSHREDCNEKQGTQGLYDSSLKSLMKAELNSVSSTINGDDFYSICVGDCLNSYQCNTAAACLHIQYPISKRGFKCDAVSKTYVNYQKILELAGALRYIGFDLKYAPQNTQTFLSTMNYHSTVNVQNIFESQHNIDGDL